MAKRQKVGKVAEVHKLLDLNPLDEGDKCKVDNDAIIKAVQQDPNSTESKYIFSSAHSWPCFPLHQAIMLGARSDVIDALCSPAALKGRVGYDQDLTALHVALKSGSSLAIVKMLIKKRKKLLLKKARHRLTPLHLACREKAPLEVVSLLVNEWPDALQKKSYGGYIPLHWACLKMAPLEVVSLLVNSLPDELQQRSVSGNGDTPLHLACLRKAPSLEVVSLLVNTCPDALQQKSNFGGTPLHWACRKAPLDIVSLLVNTWPGALQQKCNVGYTPLHYSCSGDASLEITSLLVNTWPGALQQKCNNGNTPLHIVCTHNVPEGVILFLLDQWPEAAIQKNNSNKTPFHLAQNNEKISENEKTLLSHVSTMLGDEADLPDPDKMLRFFVKLSWWKGVRLALDEYPLAIKTMDLPVNVMADFLSMIGHHCRLNTMWEIIRNEQELFAGV